MVNTDMRQIEWIEDRALRQKVGAANVNAEDIVLPCDVACELIAYAAGQNILLLGWDQAIIKDKRYEAIPGAQYEYNESSSESAYIKKISAEAVARIQAVNAKHEAGSDNGKLYFDLLFDI